MITSWEQFEVALGSDEPLPLLAIRRSQPPRHSSVGTPIEQQNLSPLDHPAVRKEFAALVRSMRGETPRLSVLEALIMENPQTIGSIAAVTALSVETVDEIIGDLTEAGLTQFITEEGVERTALTLPDTQ